MSRHWIYELPFPTREALAGSEPFSVLLPYWLRLWSHWRGRGQGAASGQMASAPRESGAGESCQGGLGAEPTVVGAEVLSPEGSGGAATSAEWDPTQHQHHAAESSSRVRLPGK